MNRFAFRDMSFGKKLTVEFDEFYVTLPNRFSDVINTDKDVAELNRERIEMIYKGKKEGKYGALILDFDKQQDGQRIPDYEDYNDDVVITPSSPPVILIETIAQPVRNKRSNEDTTTHSAKRSR